MMQTYQEILKQAEKITHLEGEAFAASELAREAHNAAYAERREFQKMMLSMGAAMMAGAPMGQSYAVTPDNELVPVDENGKATGPAMTLDQAGDDLEGLDNPTGEITAASPLVKRRQAGK